MHYVQGEVKEGKDPRSLDAKMLTKYEVVQSEHRRARRKERGLANLQYVRFQRTWVLLAAEGSHPMKSEERNQFKDIRESPIQIAGYSIYLKQGDWKKKRTKVEPLMRERRPTERRRLASQWCWWGSPAASQPCSAPLVLEARAAKASACPLRLLASASVIRFVAWPITSECKSP